MVVRSTGGTRMRNKGAPREHRGTQESREGAKARSALAREQYGGAVYLKLEDTIYLLYTPRT